MTVAERGKHGIRCGQNPHKGITNLHSEVYGQKRGYSQGVRKDENWENKINKAPRLYNNKNLENKNAFFTKLTVAHVDQAVDRKINEKQQGQLVTKPAETIKEKKKNIHPDHTEGSYRVFNELVNKAHERRLEQIGTNEPEADFMEFKYDPKSCILLVTLEDTTEVATMLDSGSTYSLKLYRTRSMNFSNSCLMSINTDNYENIKN
jgi:hypothetical protein